MLIGRRIEARTVIALLAAGLFTALALVVGSSASWLLGIDRDVAGRLHRFALAHRAFSSAMRIVSDCGSSVAWAIVLAPVFGWLLYRRMPRLAVFVPVTALGSSLLNKLIKSLVGRPRPQLPDPVAVAAGKSFPSGHSQAAIVCYGILLAVFLPAVASRLRPWLVALAGLLVALIGFSRIALGVHYLSDVVGAYLIGTAWLIAMVAAFGAGRGPTRPISRRNGPLAPDGGQRPPDEDEGRSGNRVGSQYTCRQTPRVALIL